MAADEPRPLSRGGRGLRAPCPAGVGLFRGRRPRTGWKACATKRVPYQARKPETMQEACGCPRDGLGRVGFGTLLRTVGFRCGREGKECFAERTQGAQSAGFRNGDLGLMGSQDILFLLAWQLIAVQKARQSPTCPNLFQAHPRAFLIGPWRARRCRAPAAGGTGFPACAGTAARGATPACAGATKVIGYERPPENLIEARSVGAGCLGVRSKTPANASAFALRQSPWAARWSD